MASHVFSFASLSDAQDAREALIQSGIAPERIRLHSAADEAGPVEGNFVIGNGRAASGEESSGVMSGGEVPYEKNFARQVNRGTQLMELDTISESDLKHARTLAREHNGIDVSAPNVRVRIS